jgi:hypothetical protein
MRSLTAFNFIGSDFDAKNLLKLALFDVFPAFVIAGAYCRKKFK